MRRRLVVQGGLLARQPWGSGATPLCRAETVSRRWQHSAGTIVPRRACLFQGNPEWVSRSRGDTGSPCMTASPSCASYALRLLLGPGESPGRSSLPSFRVGPHLCCRLVDYPARHVQGQGSLRMRPLSIWLRCLAPPCKPSISARDGRQAPPCGPASRGESAGPTSWRPSRPVSFRPDGTSAAALRR